MSVKWAMRAVLVALPFLFVGAGLSSSARGSDVACGAMITSDTTLTSDLDCTGTALWIKDSRITLDLGGHTLSGDGTGNGVLMTDTVNPPSPPPLPPVVVTNGTIRGFFAGVFVAGTAQGTLSNLTIVGNDRGIEFLSNSYDFRILDNTVIDNATLGMRLGERTRRIHVERNRFLHNGLGGIRAGFNASGGLYKDNLVAHNGGDGFSFFAAESAFIDNNASGNGDDGFDVDSTIGPPGYRFSGNTADRNGALGINARVLVIDDGGNSAKHNGDERQCVNVVCATNQGQD